MAKIRSRREAASTGDTAPPVRVGYFSQGPFTSTANTVSGRRSLIWATTSGNMPFVSTFTAKPSPPSASTKSGSPGSSVGSPPHTTTPSSQRLRAARDFRTACVSKGGWSAGVKAREALWQVGQRRLHPPRNTTETFRPGQSHSDKGVMALILAVGGVSSWMRGALSMLVRRFGCQ